MGKPNCVETRGVRYIKAYRQPQAAPRFCSLKGQIIIIIIIIVVVVVVVVVIIVVVIITLQETKISHFCFLCVCF